MHRQHLHATLRSNAVVRNRTLRGGQCGDNVRIAVIARAPTDVGRKGPEDQRTVTDQQPLVAAPAVYVNVWLRGFEDDVDIFLRAQLAGHYEIVPLFRARERGNQRGIQVTAERQHVDGRSSHVAPDGDSNSGVVAVGHGGRGARCPAVKHGLREGSPPSTALVAPLVVHKLDTWGPPRQRDPARIANPLGYNDVGPMLTDSAPGSEPRRRRAETQIEDHLVVTSRI